MKAPRDMAHDEPRLRLKIATRKTIKAVHGTDMAAEITGSRQQRMSDCQLANTGDFLRLDEAHALEEAARGAADWPSITRAQARNFGFALLPLPQAAPGNSEWHASLAEVSREANEAVSRICEALANDGAVTAAEIEDGRVIEEIDQAIAALARLRGLAEGVLASGGRPTVSLIRSAD